MIGVFGMQPFDAYKTYLAIKRHFTTKSYDYFKYNGIVKVGAKSFEQRRDRYQFSKLAKHKDVVGFLTANLVYGKQDAWIGDMIGETGDKLYAQYIRVRDSLTYMFEQDLHKLADTVQENIEVVDGQHPLLLKLALRNEINIETFIILNDIWMFTKSWNASIMDPVIWPDFYTKCKKYRPFLNYNLEKCKDAVESHFEIT